MDLEALRKQIDEIDTEMCDLFAQRMKVVTDIARYKKENNMVVYHPSVDEAEKELRSIMIGGDKREKMLSDFAELREIIGGAGASDRFAADIVKTIQNSK